MFFFFLFLVEEIRNVLVIGLRDEIVGEVVFVFGVFLGCER